MKKSKDKKFLAIGGPKDKEQITHKVAAELGYFGFNTSQYRPARGYGSYNFKIYFGLRGYFTNIKMIYVHKDLIPHSYKPITMEELAEIADYEKNNPYEKKVS